MDTKKWYFLLLIAMILWATFHPENIPYFTSLGME